MTVLALYFVVVATVGHDMSSFKVDGPFASMIECVSEQSVYKAESMTTSECFEGVGQ